MPHAKSADTILRLVMPAEAAASVAGDLMEFSSSGFRFWTSVIRICFSMLWKDLSASPGRMAYLTAAGAGMQTVFFLPFGACCYLLALWVGVIASLLGVDPSSHTWWVEGIFALLVLSAVVPAPYLTGRWIGRRSPGAELAPCLALAMLAGASWAVGVAVLGHGVELMNGLAGIPATAACLLVAIASLWTGAIQMRTRPTGTSALRWFERIADVEGTSSWRLSNPAQQRFVDVLLLLAPVAMAPALLVYPPSSSSLSLLVGLSLATVMLANAIVNRPLQWFRRGRAMAFIGRILFGSAAVVIVILLLRA